jgi:hypothetical protein
MLIGRKRQTALSYRRALRSQDDCHRLSPQNENVRFSKGQEVSWKRSDRVERERAEASTVQILVPEGAENQESERRQTFLDCTIRVQAIHRPSGETRGCIRFAELWVNCC